MGLTFAMIMETTLLIIRATVPYKLPVEELLETKLLPRKREEQQGTPTGKKIQ